MFKTQMHWIFIFLFQMHKRCKPLPVPPTAKIQLHLNDFIKWRKSMWPFKKNIQRHATVKLKAKLLFIISWPKTFMWHYVHDLIFILTVWHFAAQKDKSDQRSLYVRLNIFLYSWHVCVGINNHNSDIYNAASFF